MGLKKYISEKNISQKFLAPRKSSIKKLQFTMMLYLKLDTDLKLGSQRVQQQSRRKDLELETLFGSS